MSILVKWREGVGLNLTLTLTLTPTQAKAPTRARLRRAIKTGKKNAEHLKNRNIFCALSGTRYDLWVENIAKATYVLRTPPASNSSKREREFPVTVGTGARYE